jgi:nitrogenase-stabilizing/protective protein
MPSELTADFVQRLKALSSAEDFLRFFGVAYDEHVVQVNRLHILKRFFQYLQREPGLAALDEVSMFKRYRLLLAKAHDDFVRSSAQTEKVFKVFQDAAGQQHVPLARLRDSMHERLAEQRQAA